MSNKNWSVKMQVNPRRANEQGAVNEGNGNVWVWVNVQAENAKQAWAEAQKQEQGVVCDVREV